ncbi:sigma-70 family RNA polymerase sigma factor [Paenibacillus polymyxa]|uniref:RNA polymerase sigma factor n=1 Tax=Paenibacillus TaxID=44249 RepID=UPI0020B7710B|nr:MULTISPECIES: sigma-70 family RNA polymerase sigma factor [Paenibacillus]MCP3806640.1 sigma-70 family RNA polymerase sigma factor [Paenibacillus sp. Lou8.1]MDY8045170.1 sigma-70 family RNA polymerase sigma factor [Paenibacillus polymyxa]
MSEEIEYRIKRVQAGEIQDYAYIVKEYQRQIFVYCWRILGSEQEAEEAVQDIFVSAFEKISMYKPTVGFSSWLYKMAYHHCLNLIRRKNLQRKFKITLFNSTNMTSDSAAQVMERQLFSEPLSRALGQLNAEERNLLVLRIFEEKSFGEIGEIMNKSEEAIKKKYGRTKTKLKKMMEPIKEDPKCVNYKTELRNKV